MWHTSFRVYYFNLRPLCLKLTLFGASHHSTSISLLFHVCLCQLHGEHGETIAQRAMPHRPHFHSVVGTAKGLWRCSKMKAWHQEIDTISQKPEKETKNNNNKINQFNSTDEKEISPCHCWALQEGKAVPFHTSRTI